MALFSAAFAGGDVVFVAFPLSGVFAGTSDPFALGSAAALSPLGLSGGLAAISGFLMSLRRVRAVT